MRISLDKFLASFNPVGLEPRGTSFESPGYAAADRKLNIAVTTAVGEVRVEWID